MSKKHPHETSADQAEPQNDSGAEVRVAADSEYPQAGPEETGSDEGEASGIYLQKGQTFTLAELEKAGITIAIPPSLGTMVKFREGFTGRTLPAVIVEVSEEFIADLVVFDVQQNPPCYAVKKVNKHPIDKGCWHF